MKLTSQMPSSTFDSDGLACKDRRDVDLLAVHADRRRPCLHGFRAAVPGLVRYAEIPAHVGHWLAVQKPGNEAKALFHHRTRFPRHRHLPPEGGKCYPCVRYEVSPMSRAAHAT